MKPRISVVMGTLYRSNDVKALSRSVESIIAQTVTDFEFLICDDGSTAEATAMLDDYAEKDERIRLVRKEDKLSLPQKLNLCLEEAKGEFIARMDDDDYSLPTRFAKQLAFLREHPSLAFVGSNVKLQCEGRSKGAWNFPEYPSVQNFYVTQPFVHPTLMFRADALKAVNGYSEGRYQVLCEDYDLLLRLYEQGFHGGNVQDNLLIYTISDDVKAKRKMRHRWNETVTRYRRFRALGKLPMAFPYVIKPLLVGMMPDSVLKQVKAKRGADFGSGIHR